MPKATKIKTANFGTTLWALRLLLESGFSSWEHRSCSHEAGQYLRVAWSVVQVPCISLYYMEPTIKKWTSRREGKGRYKQRTWTPLVTAPVKSQKETAQEMLPHIVLRHRSEPWHPVVETGSVSAGRI